jgi:hypothetical protein
MHAMKVEQRASRSGEECDHQDLKTLKTACKEMIYLLIAVYFSSKRTEKPRILSFTADLLAASSRACCTKKELIS